MNIDDLTIGQAKQLNSMFGANVKTETLNCLVGKKVIIRTYSAGVWFGVLDKKAGNEVILIDARRLWQWFAAESISLSGVALYGVKQESRIAPPVIVWLEAIEIIQCTKKAIQSIEDCDYAKAR